MSPELILTILIVIAGAACGKKIEAKNGEDFSFVVNTSEPRKVILQNVEKNVTLDIFRYCSEEERKHGCKMKRSGRCSSQISKETFNITCLHANPSDAGHYTVRVTEKNWDENPFTFSLKVIDPGPPSIHPFTTPAMSSKAEETIETDDLTTAIIIVVVLLLAIVVIFVIVVIVVICCKKKKRKKNHTEDPGESAALNLNTNAADKPDTEESLEIVVETNFSGDIKERPEQGLNKG